MSFGYLSYLEKKIEGIEQSVANMSYVQLITNLSALKDGIAWDVAWQNDTTPYSGTITLLGPGIGYTPNKYVVILLVEVVSGRMSESDYVKIRVSGPYNNYVVTEVKGIETGVGGVLRMIVAEVNKNCIDPDYDSIVADVNVGCTVKVGIKVLKV